MIRFWISYLFLLNFVNGIKLLVLGGSGFVGSGFISTAIKYGYDVVSVSRRGLPPNNQINVIDGTTTGSAVWLKGDATKMNDLVEIFEKYGPFDGCVHTIGLLLDSKSGLQSLNQFASGSGSVPDDSATYDLITKQTAFNAIQCFTSNNQKLNDIKPFVFISAAEAGWTLPAPIPWLEDYLIAKRAVEKKLIESKGVIRPIIFRPSLIWTWSRPSALISVVPFYIGNGLRIPFIDKPVTIEDLAVAMIKSIQNKDSGIKRYNDIEALAKS